MSKKIKTNEIANRFDLFHSITEMASKGNEAAVEVLQYIEAKEQKKRSKAVIHISGSDAGEVINYTKKDLGYFFWTLLDDLYMAEGMEFIKEVIGEGGNPPSKKVQKILAERFLHAFSFEGSN